MSENDKYVYWIIIFWRINHNTDPSQFLNLLLHKHYHLNIIVKWNQINFFHWQYASQTFCSIFLLHFTFVLFFYIANDECIFFVLHICYCIHYLLVYVELFQSMDHMHDLLKEANITLVTSESFFTNPRNQIENIKVGLSFECFYNLQYFKYVEEDIILIVLRSRIILCKNPSLTVNIAFSNKICFIWFFDVKTATRFYWNLCYQFNTHVKLSGGKIQCGRPPKSKAMPIWSKSEKSLSNKGLNPL